MNAELTELLKNLPLASHWGRPEIFTDKVTIGSISLHMAGLSVTSPAGELVVASAVAADKAPLERAYFELIERTAVLDAQSRGSDTYTLYDARQQAAGSLHAALAYPVSPHPERWRYARSNGVAAHVDWTRATQAAAFELLERDRVLRSWRGDLRPVRWNAPPYAPQVLIDLYDCETYLFGRLETNEDAKVAGVFAFPRKAHAPLVYGFAAAGTALAAEHKAESECLQRLAFLWGEECPRSQPEFAATPDFHQAFFLSPGGAELLRAWLRGEHGPEVLNASAPLAGLGDVDFLDITPPHLKDKVTVVKAISGAVLPLTFGEWPDDTAGQPSRARLIHPIA